MKKLLLTALAFTTGIAFAQLSPNSVSPVGFTMYFDATNWDNGRADISGSNSIDYNTSGALDVTISASSGASDGVKFFPYDISGSGLAAFVDISNTPKVYIKMSGTVGDNIRVNLKNSSSYDFVDGYNYRQDIACTNSRWYEFDFTAASETMDQIAEIEVVHNTESAGAGSFTIDSIIIGNTGYTPTIPDPVTDVSFRGDFTNDYYKFANGDNSISVMNGELTATIAGTSATSEGIGFTVFLNSASHMIDITDDPVVKISIKGTDGDSIRVNLKNGSGNSFVDGYNYAVELDGGSAYKEYTFDFSNSSEAMDQISEIEIIHDHLSQGAGSFMINSLTIGDPDAESCEEVISTSVESTLSAALVVYPNPASSIVNVTGINNIEGLVISSTSGTQVATSSSSSIDISDIASGIYIISVITDQGTVSKLLTVE